MYNMYETFALNRTLGIKCAIIYALFTFIGALILQMIDNEYYEMYDLLMIISAIIDCLYHYSQNDMVKFVFSGLGIIGVLIGIVLCKVLVNVIKPKMKTKMFG